MNVRKMQNGVKAKATGLSGRNRWTVIAAILLMLCLWGCRSDKSSEYHMVLNGDDTFEVEFNKQFVDPGVTFVDDDNTPVSGKKQAELEQKMTVTGLEQLDTSAPGEYSIEYQYEDQTLKRLIKVLPEKKDKSSDKINDSDNSDDSSGSADDQESGAAEGTDDNVPAKGTSVTPAPANKPSPATKPNNNTANVNNSAASNNVANTNTGITPPVSDKNDSSSNRPVSKKAYTLPSDVTFDSRTVTYDGSSYAIRANNLPSGINVVYVNNTGTDAGIYNATAYFTLGKALRDKYSSVEPSSMSATLIINKATPGYTIPAGLTASEGQTLADVAGQLGEGFSFEDVPDTLVGNPGDNEFTVTFTPASANYKTVRGIKTVIHVTKKPDPVKPKFRMPADILFNDRTETYDGTKYVIVAENVPEELCVTYSDNARIDAGSQTAAAKFTLSDKGLESYSGIDGTTVMTAVLKINPATPFYTIPAGLAAVEGQTLADVAGQLGEGFSFENALTTSVGTPGDNKFNVTYTPDSSNYKTVNGIEVTITVSKADRVYTLPSNVRFSDVEGVYNGTEFKAEVVNLPEVVEVIYSDNTRSNAGEQTARAEFRIKPAYAAQYDSVYPGFMEAKITVHQAIPAYTVPTGLTAYVGQALRDVAGQLGEGFEFEDPLDTSLGHSAGTFNFTVKYTPSDENYKTIEGIPVSITVTYEGDDINRNELIEAVKDAEAVKEEDYTPESYQAFLEAYEKAKQMLETTQDDVDNKADAIRTAIELLEKRDLTT